MYVTDSRTVLELVGSTLRDLEARSRQLNSIVQSCVRISRLRQDIVNFWWLSYELLDASQEHIVEELAAELRPHFSSEEFNVLAARWAAIYEEERELGDERPTRKARRNKTKRQVQGLAAIESRIAQIEGELASPPGPHNLGLSRLIAQEQISQLRAILARVEQRVHAFLSATEQQLLAGQVNADIFERNRQFVDVEIEKLNPELLAQFNAAFRRIAEGDNEARSQALLTCRRILKGIADVVYPPRTELVRGGDGKERALTDDAYIARLWQFVFENLGKGRSSEVLGAQLQDIGRRIDSVYALANKGAHANVNEFEVNQCAIQTYLVAGDIFRLRADTLKN